MSKKTVKLLSLLVVFSIIVAISLAGCGGPATSQGTSDAASSAAPEASQQSTSKVETAPVEPVTISYTSYRYEDEATFKSLVDKFQQENPGITVKLDLNKDQNAYYQTLKANIASGENLDTYDIHPTPDFVTYAKEGVSTDLSDLPFAANLTDGAKKLATVDGKIYGFNQAVNLICMIYNKELFSKHNVDVPKDWNDFVSICKKLKAEGEGGVAYLGADVKAVWLTNALVNEIMGADSCAQLINGIDSGDTLTVKDNVQFMSVLKTLSEINKEKILYDNSVTTKYPQALALFAQKKAPMMMMGTWTLGTRDTDYPGIDIGIFPVPNVDNTNVFYAEPAQITCVYAKSKNIDAAKKWVNFLGTPENSSIYINATKMAPTLKGVKTDFAGAELLTAANEQGVNVLPIIAQPNAEFWTNSYNAMLENILFKGSDVDKEVASFEAALKKADIKNKK